MTILKLTQIYSTLSSAGFRKAQVRSLLPDWWDDAVGKTEMGTWEFVMLVARRLSLDANALSQGNIQPIGSVQNPAYKHRRTAPTGDYIPSTMIAASLAEAISAACIKPFAEFNTGAASIRHYIRERNNGIVDFNGLLAFCWEVGIPVIPLPHLPTGIKKMDGAVFSIKHRPVIIIARKNDSRSWLNFILAHELAHYCLGHLQASSSIIDADLKSDVETQTENQHDAQESEADQFALQLLGGEESTALLATWTPRMDGVTLAAQARANHKNVGASAGHLVLRHAYMRRSWREAQMALRFLDEDFEAQQELVNALAKNINLNVIADDLQDLVSNVTGLTNV